MLNKELFEFAKIHCANADEHYIMAKEERHWETVLKYIENHNLRIENLIFKPRTNQIRLMLLPCRANKQMTEVFNINRPPIQFLRRLWQLEVLELQSAMTQYMIQSDLKYQYDELNEDEKTWLTSVILGAKE